MSPCGLSHLIRRAPGWYLVCMDKHETNGSVTALILVLALVFTAYVAMRATIPDLPLHVLHAVATLP